MEFCYNHEHRAFSMVSLCIYSTQTTFQVLVSHPPSSDFFCGPMEMLKVFSAFFFVTVTLVTTAAIEPDASHI